MKSPLSVAAYQMVTGPDVGENARKIHGAIDESARNGARLLVVPECALSGYLPAEEIDFDLLADAQEDVARHVVEAETWLALGTTVRQDGECRNTVVLLSPTGQVAARYDKTHLTGGDRRRYAPGDRLPVFREGDWTFGIQICFDMRFAENWRILRRKGAELVLHASNASRDSAWKVPVLEGAIRSRAADNGMFVVSANDARTPQMMVSAICDPDGKDLARAPVDAETIIYAELDHAAVKTDFLDRRRLDLWNRPENRELLLG